MPPHMHSDQSDEATSPSRRSILRGAAGAGAVGLTAAVGGGFFAAGQASAATKTAATRTAATNQADAKTAAVTEAEAHEDEPLVVYLRDKTTGEFEIFNGTKQVTVRNKQLVSELLQGLATAQ